MRPDHPAVGNNDPQLCTVTLDGQDDVIRIVRDREAQFNGGGLDRAR